MSSITSRLVLAGVLILLVACAKTGTNGPRSVDPGFKTGKLPTTGRVMLMPLDIELYEVQAGGLIEPNAAWTRAAKTHITAATEAELRRGGSRLVSYEPPVEGSPAAHSHQQLIKLHDAVGSTLLRFRTLPTTKDRFDWSLGADAGLLRGGAQPDYALFIVVRDSYSSGGRRAMQFLGALLGAVVSGGVQLGFASLVDLRTGDIVWYNRLARAEGDLRTAEPAREAVKKLLSDFPL